MYTNNVKCNFGEYLKRSANIAARKKTMEKQAERKYPHASAAEFHHAKSDEVWRPIAKFEIAISRKEFDKNI